MTIALIVLAAALVATLAVLGWVGWRLAPGPVTTGQRVTVHTKLPDDQTLHGLLVREYRDRLELVDAAYVTAQGEQPIPGTVRVPAGNVSWRQDH